MSLQGSIFPQVGVPSWNKRWRGSDIYIDENWGGSKRRGRGPVFGDWDHEDVGLPRRRGTYEECQANQDPSILNIADPCRGLPSGGFRLPETPDFDFPGMGGDYEKLPYKRGSNVDPYMFLAEFAGKQLGRVLRNI